MLIFYGAVTNFVNITGKFTDCDTIFIFHGDQNRTKDFGDPIVGVEKFIVILDDWDNIAVYPQPYVIRLIKQDGKINLSDVATNQSFNLIDRINLIHSKLNIGYGHIKEELPEQVMAVSVIQPEAIVLEIGGNIGRNSCVISSLLRDSGNLVVMEANPFIAKQLEENRHKNNFSFHIETSALSKRKLLQRGWHTVLEDEYDPNVNGAGWMPIPIIDWSSLQEKYNKKFDTLVLDCEGAIYFILKDFPNLLENFKLILIENDYASLEHKLFVEGEFKTAGFKLIYSQPLNSPTEISWGNSFYEIYSK